MTLTVAFLAFLSPCAATADIAAPPSIVCPRGTTFRRVERRYEYCEPFRCDASGACPSGFVCSDAPLFVDGDRAIACEGPVCPKVRVCLAPDPRELFPDEPPEPAPPTELPSEPRSGQSGASHEPSPGAESGGCGCAAGSNGLGVAFAPAALLLVWVRRRRGRA
jgi:MYXO-CTERM domain-containing protein